MREFRSELVVTRVIDGDTVRGDWDLGAGVWLKDRTFRLHGIDTPEMRGETKEAGQAAKQRLCELITLAAINGAVSIRTHKAGQDSFGRYLIEIFQSVFSSDPATINELLVREGHAIPFMAICDE